MKVLLPLILIICCLQLSTAQVVFDSTLAEDYHYILRGLPDNYRKSILKLEGSAIFSKYGCIEH